MKPGEAAIVIGQLPGHANGFRVFIDAQKLAAFSEATQNKPTVATTTKGRVHVCTIGVVNQELDRRIQKDRAMRECRPGLLLAIGGHRESASISGGMSSSPEDSSSQANQRSSLHNSSFFPWPISISFFSR